MIDEGKIKLLLNVCKKHDTCGAQELALAKDYLVEVSLKINSLRPIHDCASCRHFRLTDCELVPGKMPPENVLKSGCEMWSDAFEIPWS